MEHRRVCFRMLSLLPLVQISKLSQANSLLFGKVCCRTPRGVRGLKFIKLLNLEGHTERRTPRGVRGLKLRRMPSEDDMDMSHPSRGAWIEMLMSGPTGIRSNGRTPRGVRGLK